MPQLLPFYFVNQLSFGLLILGLLIYISGTYILPIFNYIYVTRMYIIHI